MTMTVKWHGDLVKAKVKAGAERGLMLAAEDVLEKSNRVVPIEDSDLLKSGHAWPPDQVGIVGGGAMQAAVTYDTPYAVRQHEELTYRHDAGHTAKYLENTVNEARAAKTLDKLVAQEVKKAMR